MLHLLWKKEEEKYPSAIDAHAEVP